MKKRAGQFSLLRIVRPMAEDVGVDGRGKFYEEVGTLRDVVQNHILQIIALLGMEPPVGSDDDASRDEKVRVLKPIRPLSKDSVIRGPIPRVPQRGEGGAVFSRQDEMKSKRPGALLTRYSASCLPRMNTSTWWPREANELIAPHGCCHNPR